MEKEWFESIHHQLDVWHENIKLTKKYNDVEVILYFLLNVLFTLWRFRRYTAILKLDGEVKGLIFNLIYLIKLYIAPVKNHFAIWREKIMREKIMFLFGSRKAKTLNCLTIRFPDTLNEFNPLMPGGNKRVIHT